MPLTDPANPAATLTQARLRPSGPSPRRRAAQAQRGGFVMGLIVGLVIGLALALGVALYVTKAPVPFINKVPQRSAEQDAAEAQRNKNWDPNAPLASKAPRPAPPQAEVAASGAAPGAVAGAPAGAAAASAPASVRNPAAILSGQAATPAGAASAAPATKAGKAAPGSDPFTYFVQAGAFQRADDAEAQRAKLTMLGLEPRVLEREQAGRTVYRVRMGPFDKQAEAEALREKLAATGMEAALVRLERAPQ